MMINRIIVFVLVFFSNTFFAQSVFDKYENQEDVSAILVNKKMFSLLSNVNANDKETQQYSNLIKKLDDLKVFVTSNNKKSRLNLEYESFYNGTNGVNIKAEYFDKNHYGPLFSILIAPFAILPNNIGLMLWGMVNVSILFYAVGKLPISFWGKNIILLLSLIETLTSTQNLQFNPMLCSWIILSYVTIKNSQLSLAAFLIVAGTFIKLYGVVALPFIFFTKDYKKIFKFNIRGFFVQKNCNLRVFEKETG